MMSHTNPTEQELLKTILEPLLEDFQYWFSRARHLLESERITFLSMEEQAKLLERVKSNQQEVQTAKMLFEATGKQAGIDTRALVPWHKLVAECWQVSRKWRSHKQENPPTA
jgi:predicted flavoprotein YhiN